MRLTEILAKDGTTFSFEFFPPKTAEAAAALFDTIRDLERLRPSFVSVTYGAGGGTRELTRDLVIRIKQQTTLEPVPHLTCVQQTEAEIRTILNAYRDAGIQNVLALRGDPPKDEHGVVSAMYNPATEPFKRASELVAYVHAHASGHTANAGTALAQPPAPIEDFPATTPARKTIAPECTSGFDIAVAGFPEGHPETPNRLVEIDHLKAKIDAGAGFIITQLFFDNRDFYDFRDRCELAGIKVPIIAGIMPITSASGMRRMAELALGARFPAPLLRAVRRASATDDGVRRVGVHWATEQCRDLLDRDVAGIHFYTLNRSTATREVYATLGVADSRQLASF